jgi:CheY-like chemotaxis protein
VLETPGTGVEPRAGDDRRRRPAIVAVDDEPAVLAAVARDLRRGFGERFRVMRAGSGAEGLELLRQLRARGEQVALLVADQRMPGLSGTDYLVKAKEFVPEAKRVLLTAYADTEAAIQAINEVALDYYLLKPWDPPEEQLFPVVEDLLTTWEASAALDSAGVRVIGVEVAEAAVARARRLHPECDFRLVPLDGPLPFEDGSFELVWASEVIEHVTDTARWLSEVRRVLVPRGRLLVTTPSHGRLRVAVFGVGRFSEPLGDHLHLYTQRSLRTLLDEFGFSEIRVQAVEGPPLLRRSLFASAIR